ncbi:MAG: hypothetical protein JW709_10105 [Sedimentisphaerales bacterium]|nr:hypothetical protein [Sedimentisphaerales bacterium]
MKKAELFDLIVKGFGVGFLMLAIIAIPKMLEGIIMTCFHLINGVWDHGGDELAKYMRTLWTTQLSASLGAIFRFIIYLIAAVNFLRSGSWVKKLMGPHIITDASE